MSAGAGDAGAAPVAAVIDVGSNSVLLLVVTIDRRRCARVVDEALETTRLGSGLHRGGTLDPTARARTRDAVVAMAARARAAGATRVWAFATGAVRDAGDGEEFARELGVAAGVPVEVLSGEREAYFAYGGARAGLGDAVAGPLLVVDVGGRTSELTLGLKHRIRGAVSLPLGALTLTEAHGSDRRRVAAAAMTALRQQTDLFARARTQCAVVAASGGTATALAALDLGLSSYEGRRVHGHRLALATLAVLAEQLAGMSAEARARLPGLDPGRAAILPAGAIVLERVAAAAGAAEVIVSDHGVRHGYLGEALAADGLGASFRELYP